MIRTATALLLFVLWSGPVLAAVFEAREFDDPEQQQRYTTLINELRCLVCQNQSIADSNADLAADLRREVHGMLTAGASNAEIVDFMVARYGDFVLYNPPFKAVTLGLWLGPFLLCALGLAFLLYQLVRRNRKTAQASTLSGDAKQRARGLLEEPPGGAD